ncbi:MAG: DUF2892 domain-containing protein [Gammaproteobacteria bacterium]
MKYFEMTANISGADKGFRAIAGMALLGMALAHPTSALYATVFPMIGAYFVLTAIMEWDPIGYLVQSIQNVLNHLGEMAGSSAKGIRTPQAFSA